MACRSCASADVPGVFYAAPPSLWFFWGFVLASPWWGLGGFRSSFSSSGPLSSAGVLPPLVLPCSLLGVRCSVLAVGCILRCCLGGAGCGAQPSVHTRECFSLCCACSWHGLSLALACSPFLGSGWVQIVSGLVASLVATSSGFGLPTAFVFCRL